MGFSYFFFFEENLTKFCFGKDKPMALKFGNNIYSTTQTNKAPVF